MNISLFLRSIINTSRNVSQTTFRILSTNAKTSINPETPLSTMNNSLILTLTLPSRQETCRFYFDLQTATVDQLIHEIKQEDSGVEHVHIYDHLGQLLSKSYLLKSLINSQFTIKLNNQRTFLFDSIQNINSNIKDNFLKQNQTDGPSTENTVATLYHSLNIMNIYHKKYLELKREANELTQQLEPLEKIKNNLASICQRYTTRCIWYGLGAMSFQVGILAELTWDVYSWDIVEPISYFVAYGTAMSIYAFHLMTRFDFEYVTMTDRLFLRKFYREARRQSFNVWSYNQLKNRLFIVQTDLARLRAPLILSLPIPPNPLKCKISGEELNPLDIYRARQRNEK